MLEKPDWRAGSDGVIAGGREVGKNIVETYCGKKRPGGKWKGCATHSDFREMFDKEKDLTAVEIMTPAHLHALISITAMRKGKHVIMHKPLANRLKESRMVVDTARQTGVERASTGTCGWDPKRARLSSQLHTSCSAKTYPLL